jgi:hypothetical protein
MMVRSEKEWKERERGEKRERKEKIGRKYTCI